MQTGLLVAYCSYLEATVVYLAILIDKKFETLIGFIEILIIFRAMVMRKYILVVIYIYIYSVCMTYQNRDNIYSYGGLKHCQG